MSAEHRFIEIISGARKGAAAGVIRGVLAPVELLYATATYFRNKLYEWRVLPSDRLPRPSVCVGNITTGGTGKTPVVRWLADQLRQRGRRPAVLMRGYKSNAGRSDEQRLLARQLELPVIADPNRLHGAEQALKIDPHIDIFVLDDGFQRRSIHRDFDLVLIDATNPFGYGHQLPRGLLRESPHALKRAAAILVTRTESVAPSEVKRIDQLIRRYNAWSPVYHCKHVHPDARMDAPRFMFCGIGNPEAFRRQLSSCVGHRYFADHHAYTASDISQLQEAASQSGAGVLVTTEKDWIKIEPLLSGAAPRIPIVPLKLAIEFEGSHEEQLLEQILAAINPAGS